MKNTPKTIELLSPAKDLATGLRAIQAGADAVYIGAPKFGARAAAGNSLEDIEALINKAHIFGVKVYVTMNTILMENELVEAEAMARKLAEIGADALIVQDMAYAEMNLPIALHASTQCDNRTPEKVQFLNEVGFRRVVLARELNLSEIKAIHDFSPNTELEFFVHGALCVSRSGNCYLSEVLSNRSANRGLCSQPCRLTYDLIDSTNKVIARNKHLLCLRDLNLTDYLEQMIDAGVTSFKIEGRLKTSDYVENVTAHYRQEIDKILAQKETLKRSSIGETRCGFTPNVAKSFNRGFTSYFIGNDENYANPGSPKSIGEKIGQVETVGRNYFTLNAKTSFTPNDGICFYSEGVLIGTNINHFSSGRIYPNKLQGITKGVTIYRNHDEEFLKQMKTSPCIRTIQVAAKLIAKGKKLILNYEANGISGTAEMEYANPQAKNEISARQTIVEQIGKLGNTDFCIGDVEIETKKMVFIPISVINNLRRQAIADLENNLTKHYHCSENFCANDKAKFPTTKIGTEMNISNSKAEQFYKKHGVQDITRTDEFNQGKKFNLMTTKLCLRREYGLCPKQKTTKHYTEPLFIVAGGNKLRLGFDCKNCEMNISKAE